MACVLIQDCPFYNPRLPHLPPGERSDFSTRLSIFLICAESVGAAALLWALVVLHRLHKPIPDFVIIVLLNDLLELLLNPYIITKQDDCSWNSNATCRTVMSSWGAFSISGVLLQQMMVLESVLVLRYPSFSDHVFFNPRSFIQYVIAFICFFLCEFFGKPILLILSVFLLVSVNVISWIVVCRKPPNEHSSNRTKKPDLTLLAYATVTTTVYLFFLSLYMYTDVWRYGLGNLLKMSLCLLSLRVMVDPLLCVLVCKQIHKEKTPQKTSEEDYILPIESNADSFIYI